MREWTDTMAKPDNKTEGGFVWGGFINKGPSYIDPQSGETKEFIGEDGRRYLGLLDPEGRPLKLGEPIHILWFAMWPAEE